MSLLQSNPTLKAALALAKAGIPVLPLDGKVPIERGGFHSATCDLNEVRQKWDHGASRWNIGIPTGAASGLFVVDVDNKPGSVDGFQSLAQLERTYGTFTATVAQETGYGRHFFFRPPGWRVKCSAGVLAPGIDIRGDGGYVIIGPSIHPGTGRPYRWADGRSPADIAVAEAPTWLLDKLRRPADADKVRDSVCKPQVHENYGLTALRHECRNIVDAPNGQQEGTLNRASYLMGTLIGAGALDEATAVLELKAAAFRMVTHDKARPWNANDITFKIAKGISDGRRKPRKVI